MKLKDFVAVLLATLVFAIGLPGNRLASAATATHKVTDTTGTVIRVELTNVDLQAYAKYNADVEAVNKDLVPQSELSRHLVGYTKRKIMLVKAVPDQTAKIRIVPESNYKTDSFSFNMTLVGRYPFKITNNSFLHIKDGKEEVNSVNDSTYGNPYKLTVDEKPWTLFFPQNADMLHVCWVNWYWYRREGTNQKQSIRTEYYIFRDDEAFKKAYKLWTGKTITGPIGASSSASPKDPAKPAANAQTGGNQRTTVQPQHDDEDSDGFGTIGKVGVGLGAAGAIGFGASRLFGGGKGSGAGPDSSGAASQYPQEPNSFVYTDPATGAQTLYERDPNTGEWFNPSTGGIVDMNDLDRFNRQRMADKAWTNDQMKNLSDRNTAVDKAWQNQDQQAAREMQKTFDEIDRQGAKDKAAIHSGTYHMTDDQRTEYLNNRQEQFVTKQEAAHQTLRNWDRAVSAAEGVQKAADIGMDIAATAAKAVDGGVVSGRIKDAYSMTKSIAGNTTDAIVRGKSIWGGIGKGIADGAVDIAQNNANGVYKALSYVGGEGFKGGLDAAWKGENVVKGAFKGTAKGAMKLGIDKVGEKISNSIKSPTDSLRESYNHAREIRTVYSKGISQRSVDALQKMNIDKHLANVKKAEFQSWANNITNAMSSNLLPDATFGD